MADADDIDARFRAIVDDQLADLSSPRPDHRPDDFNLTEAMDRATPDDPDWARYEPEEMAPTRPWRLRVSIGAVLLTAGAVLGLLGVFGAELTRPLGWGGAASAVIGLALLLWSAAGRKPDERWDDGAQL